jgi:hypothetical protein
MTTLTYYETAITKSLSISLDNSGERALTDITGNAISTTNNILDNQGTISVKTTLADVTISYRQYVVYNPVSQTYNWYSSINQSVNSQTVFDYQNIPGKYTDLSQFTGAGGAFMTTVFTGNDTIYGGALADKIFGFAGNDNLLGYASNDIIYGGTGGDTIDGGSGNDTLSGSAGDDYIYGGDGNDTMYGGDGSVEETGVSVKADFTNSKGVKYMWDWENGMYRAYVDVSTTNKTYYWDKVINRYKLAGVDDTIDGGVGTDTTVFSSNRASYTVSKTTTGWTVSSSAEGVDTLANVERLKFADTAIALDTSGVGGQTYRLYKAAFNRTPDVGGLGFWISGMDGGVSLNAVAQGFVNSAEFKTVYGTSPTNAQIVTRFYDNVLGRAAESGGYNYWLGILDSGNANVAQVLASFSESPENQAAVIGVIGNGILYTPYG